MTQFIEVRRAANGRKELLNVQHIVKVMQGTDQGQLVVDLSPQDTISIRESYDEFMARLHSTDKVIPKLG